MPEVLNEACPLTGQPATITSGEFDGWTVSSPYTDGSFKISSSAVATARSLASVTKVKVISWIIDRHRAGEIAPLVTTMTFDEVAKRPNLTYDQRVERLFLMLKSMNFGLSSTIRTTGVVDGQYLQTMGRLQAWLELPPTDTLPFLSTVVGEGLLSHDGNAFRITADGMRRVDRLSSLSVESSQVFVAMWFSAEMNDPYDLGFEPAIIDCGYRALRIDKKEHSNKIDDEIISEIRRSRFLVADFTCQLIDTASGPVGVPRGGVYYEAGFAQGLNIDVIWTVRADCIQHVHFDTRQYAHIVWDDPADLRAKLRNRIGAVIGRLAPHA